MDGRAPVICMIITVEKTVRRVKNAHIAGILRAFVQSCELCERAYLFFWRKTKRALDETQRKVF